MTRIGAPAFLLAAVCAAALSAADGDWPQWRGPDSHRASQRRPVLLKQWPAAGPKLAWKIKGLGDGFSTPSVAGGRVYILGTKGQG